VSTRRRFQDSHSGGSRLRTRRISQIIGGTNEERRDDATDDEQLWAVDSGDGQLQLVRGSGALKELIRSRGLAKTTPVFMLSTIPTRLGDVAEVQGAFEDSSGAGPARSEPELEAPGAEASVPAVETALETVAAESAVEAAAAVPAVETAAAVPAVEVAAAVPAVEVATAAPAARAADDDFSLLDRPFDDGDYYEDPPAARWLRPAGVAAVVLVLGFGGYQLFHSRSVARTSTRERAPEPVAVAAVAPPVQPAAVPAAPAPVPVVAAALAPAPAPVVVAAAPVPAPAVARAAAPAPVPAAAPAPVPAAAPAPVAAAAPAPAAASAEADGDVEPARPLSPRYPALVAEGERQFQAGRTRRAQTLFEQALVETPEGTAALIGLGYVHLDKGKVPQAIALFERALVQDRENATALFGLAESHRQAGNRSAALAEFQKFLSLRATGSDSDIARQLVQQLSSGG
jgi:hypothetical protein